MQQNDKAMVITMASLVVRNLLQARAKAHEARSAFYDDRAKRMQVIIKESAGPEAGEEDVNVAKSSNSAIIDNARHTFDDAVKKARHHRAAAKICDAMAVNMREQDQTFEGAGLEILAYLLDTENPTAMPPFYRMQYE